MATDNTAFIDSMYDKYFPGVAKDQRDYAYWNKDLTTGNQNTSQVEKSFNTISTNRGIVGSLYDKYFPEVPEGERKYDYWNKDLTTGDPNTGQIGNQTPAQVENSFVDLRNKGLVSTALNNKPTTVAPPTPTASPTTPSTQGKVTDQMLVEKRVQDLLRSDNPYIRAAEDRVREQFAGRGMVNSTQYAEAAERARIEAALQIAQPDAETYSKFGLTGYEAELTDWLDNRSNDRTLQRDAIQQQYLLQTKNADLANELTILTVANDYDEKQAVAAHQRSLDYFIQSSGIELTNKKDLLTFTDAIDAAAEERNWNYSTKQWVQNSIMTIETLPNMTTVDKTNLIDRVLNLATVTSSYDFTGIPVI